MMMGLEGNGVVFDCPLYLSTILDMGLRSIENLGEPVHRTDAATRGFVEDVAAGLFDADKVFRAPVYFENTSLSGMAAYAMDVEFAGATDSVSPAENSLEFIVGKTSDLVCVS